MFHTPIPAMRNRTPPQMRRASRFVPKVLIGAFSFAIVVLAVLWLRVAFAAAPYRQTIVIAGNPAHILSLNASKTGIILIDVPEETVISAVKGYGAYSVRSLTTLDGIDKHYGSLISGSISNAFGIPVSWYVAPSDISSGAGSVEMIRRVFSWGSILRRLSGKLETSIPMSTWVHFVWALRFIPADAVKVIDIRPAIVPLTSPDGGIVMTLDESKLDFLLQSELYDTGLRAENLTVAVYNTTDVASVGLRASRQLSRLGVQLVFVGNAEQHPRTSCVLSGSDTALKSKTAKFIRSYFRCKESAERSQTGKETGADLVVELGSDYAGQYK